MMKKKALFILLLAFLGISGLTFAQINITGPSSPFTYTEGFNSWTAANATTGMPAGWVQSGASAYRGQGTGSSNSGGVWSYGTSGDWSLGALYSGSTSINTYTVSFKNTTGFTITTLEISYDFEGWRNGGGNTGGMAVTATGITIGTSLNANFTAGTTNKTTGVMNVSIANNATFSISFKNIDGSGSDNGVAVDNFELVAGFAPACTTPNALAYVVQPSNVVQDATMTSVQVKAICSATGATATSYTGPITLTMNTPGCGYTAQTVNAVAGVATFSNIKVLRSAQTGLTFTASASGLTSATSNTFNVTTPAGAATTSVITQNNFDAATTWGYAAGTPSYSGSGGGGTDVTGTKSNGGSNVLCKSHSTDNGSDDVTSTNTVTFNNVTGLSTYDQVDFEFKVVSFGSGTGAGNDSGEDFVLQVSTDNGSSWTTALTEKGLSNRLFALSATPVTSLSLSNSTYTSGDTKSAFKLTLTGISQFRFRFTATNNRTNENWGIDDVKLTGTTHTAGTPFNLPTAAASSATVVCNPADGIQLGVTVTSFQTPLTYSWTPTPTIDEADIQNPMAFPTTASQTYTVAVTDGHNCKATSTVTVTNPGFGGTAGLWTGALSSDWFDCRNWDDFRVPTAATNVTINQTASDECIIEDAAAVCNSLTLNSTNSTVNNLTLQTNGTLTVNNAVSITNSGSGDVALILKDISRLTCGNLTIDGVSNGDAKLKHEAAVTLVVVNGNLTIQPGGELDLSDGTTGTPGGTVQIKGNFINNATEGDFKQDESTVIFNGTANQDISIAGTNKEIFYNISVNKSAGTLTLSDNVQITNQLTMAAGNINTQTSMLELGISTTSKGTLSYTSGYVLGAMKRWFNGTNTGNASSLFPMGFDQGGIKNRNVSVEYTSAPAAGGHLTVQFIGTDMGMSGIPILAADAAGAGFDVTSTENLGYWKIDNEAGKLTDGSYKITCTGEGFGTITDLSRLTLLKRVVAYGPDWFCPGTHIGATGTTSIPVLARSGVSGWSNFGFGGGTANPLPVELIAFTAQCGDRTSLSWSTASESNSHYFSVEKTTDGIHWNEVAQVLAAGNTSQLSAYTAQDLSRQQGVVYYRLKQFDLNGASRTYNPISLDCEQSPVDFTLYPNPNDGNFSISLSGPELNGKITATLLSSEGKLIETKETDFAGSAGILEFSRSMLSAGIYFVSVSDGNDISQTIRMVVK